MEKVLIVDDDISFCTMLKSFLKKKGFLADDVYSHQDALKLSSYNSYKVILTDFRLPDKSGIELLKDIRKRNEHAVVIVMTAYADIRMAVQAIKLGAFEYVTKPVNPDEIIIHIKNGIQKYRKEKEENKKTVNDNNQSFPVPSGAENQFEYVYSGSKASETIHKYIELVGPTDMSVIIQGESGTGKEYIARKIHEQSKRSTYPFVAIDCGSLSKELAGSEFFGHIKGSFTGALNDKTGQFEIANSGTLFLDEIGNLSYEIQVKLLRAIQERKIRKIGSNKDIPVNVRIITATNEDLISAVKRGLFREDLYHRLNEFSILVPPLRERIEDIKTFSDYFLKKANIELGRNVRNIPGKVWNCFEAYSWPGNIREIKNVIRRAVLLSENNEIKIQDLPQEIIHACTPDKKSSDNGKQLRTITEKTEKDIIVSTLHQAKFNKSKTAKILNIDRKTLYNKLKLYGIKKTS